MSVAELQPMQETSQFAELSPAVVAMLRDEANLSTARHVLDDARQDCLLRLDEIKAQRPAFGFLAASKKREEYASAVSQIEAQQRSLESMISRVNAARERLQPGLRASLVDYLNRADPMYRQGLRASRFHEHWRRGHTIVQDRLKAFLRDTRDSRHAINSDAAAGRARHSNDAIWRLGNARNAAVELDREIDALNQVAAEHKSFVENTPFAQIQLPVIESWHCMEKIDTVTLRPPVDALVEVDALLNEFMELRQPSLATIQGMFNGATAEHAQLAETRLRQCWSSLLAYAEAHLVSDAELEPTLYDIERRQAEAERARVVSQAVRPFDSER
jgi:hypothetical protein